MTLLHHIPYQAMISEKAFTNIRKDALKHMNNRV